MESQKIAVIGLGYVGLPLARLLATKHQVVGFDKNKERVSEIMLGVDSTSETNKNDLACILQHNLHSSGLFCTSEAKHLESSNFFIITVPTQEDKNKRANLSQLIAACYSVARYISNGNIVIIESTVPPGTTENICVPLLEKVSGLKFNSDFFVGYSPERLNPGDKVNTIEKIKKITSGSTKAVADEIDKLYNSVISAGTYRASSIKVAETAKLIENSQRDLNIAFMNEIATITNLLGVDTNEVLEAAGTKWNFLPFKPGLVGGHCIGAASNFLIQKAQEHGYNPEIILSGRRINNGMGNYIASLIVKNMLKKGIHVSRAKVLLLGITFKENCPDIRNTKVIDIYNELADYDMQIDVYDPWANPTEVEKEFNIKSTTKLDIDVKYDAIVLAVSHKEFLEIDFNSIKKDNALVYDVKGFLDKDVVDCAL